MKNNNLFDVLDQKLYYKNNNGSMENNMDSKINYQSLSNYNQPQKNYEFQLSKPLHNFQKQIYQNMILNPKENDQEKQSYNQILQTKVLILLDKYFFILKISYLKI